jgi:two-component system, chemotaxis family, CheB/CheR fusion protein
MPKVNRTPGHLVVVGSSAGGIEALSVLVGSLKPNFGAPIVLAQHLDPSRQSYLPTILERKTSLPIVLVSDREELENGKIYVVPSNRHVMIKDGSVHVERDHGNRPRPSVDLLLSSAAQSYGEGVIAVILTGTGSDGAAGAVEVKNSGGLVIIQNPETAAYPFMPQALPPTAVDYVVDLERVGSLLTDITTGSLLPESIAESAPDTLTEILQFISARSSVDFRPYKPATVLRRIGRRMAGNHVRTLTDYLAFLSAHPVEVQELVRSLLIKVTEFFRDPDAFAFLRSQIMPALIERGRDNGRVLRCWSAGCATGEEAYSLALMIADLLGHELPEWQVKVFATDLDDSAIAFARRGLYPVNVLSNVPEAYRARYFEPSDNGARIAKALRQMVIFGQQDISRGVPFPRIDLVVCRNLLIYFKPELQQEVLDRFAFSMHLTKGYLFLGKAETARPSRATFHLVNKKWKVYQCMAGPFAAPNGRMAAGRVGHEAARPMTRRSPAPSHSRADAETEIGLSQFRRLNEVTLRNIPIGLIVVDRRYRVVSINGLARRILGIREVSSENDFLHAARGLPYADIRAAIDRLFREHTVATLPDVVLDSGVSDSRHLSVHITPLQLGGEEEYALIAVTDTTEALESKRNLLSLETEQKQLIDELSGSNRRLVELNKELQDTNEELQAANEEMMLTQEELQSTNEEFEATNEELQATNEELETNNEELQATNEELETTNEELTARTSELHEMGRIVAAERSKFSGIVELAPSSIVVLRGKDLQVETFNRPGLRLMAEGAVAGKPFELVALPSLKPVIAGSQEAMRSNRTWTSSSLQVHLPWEGDAPSQRIYTFTVVPIRAGDGSVDGVVLYGEDVTEQESAQREERREKLRLIVEHASQAGLALYDAITRRLLFASPLYLRVVRRLTPIGQAVEAAESAAPDVRHGDAGDLHVFSRPWQELQFGEQRETMVAAFDEAVSRGKPIRIRELRLSTDGRSESVWDFSLIPIAYATEAAREGVRYVCVSCVEVTEAVREREGIVELDRMKNEFLSMASHELRTPLMPLTAYTDVLGRLVDSPNEKELVQKLQHQIRYMARLTDDLLDVARLQTGKFRLDLGTVDLRRVVRDGAEQAMPVSRRPEVRVAYPDEDRHVVIRGDEGRLVQAVFNLISNATTHAPDAQFVDVRLSRSDGTAPTAVIEVTDYGPGVPEEERAHIFDRFYQLPSRPSSRKGLGLGLYICRSIVEQHGGSIDVEPVSPHGTSFRIRLPLTPGD